MWVAKQMYTVWLLAYEQQNSRKQSGSVYVGSRTELYSLVVGLWVTEHNNTG